MMIKYFVLCVALMGALSFGPTWWVWLQSVCLAGLILCDVSSWVMRKRLEIEYLEREIRRNRVQELNPFKWGKE